MSVIRTSLHIFGHEDMERTHPLFYCSDGAVFRSEDDYCQKLAGEIGQVGNCSRLGSRIQQIHLH